MGKRRSHDGETDEERKERKRIKKDHKKKAKVKKEHENQDVTRSSVTTTTQSSYEALQKSNLFFRKKLELTISLLPSALSNVLLCAEDSLRSYLLKYSDGIGGIMLAFENTKVMSESDKCLSGVIFNELPHIHYKITTDALVFIPSPGCKMSGIVTDASFHSHLSLVVLKYFNASISADILRDAGFKFDTVQLQWHYTRDANVTVLRRDHKIEFVCNVLHESGGMISMEGTNPVLVATTV